jgi:hypothetical protein
MAVVHPMTDSAVSVSSVRALAERHEVPVEDVLLIAVNLWGVSSAHQRHRARVTVRLSSRPEVAWMAIVPLNARRSPFSLRGLDLFLGEERVGQVGGIDTDEALGGYFRDNGRAATLNPNGRSRCVGCAFCPNTLEAAADPRLSEETDLNALLAAMGELHPLGTLSGVREVTVSTGCFEREDAAVEHLMALRTTLGKHRSSPRIGLLTSVVRSPQALGRISELVAPFVLRLTAECFDRRDLLLKASKARLRPEEMPPILRAAQHAGLSTSFTYVVGLDSVEEMRRGVESLIGHVDEFPNFQVYQAHNSIMEVLRAPGSGVLDFYLRARTELERIVGSSGLRPKPWECYRSLWYFTFAGERLPLP